MLCLINSEYERESYIEVMDKFIFLITSFIEKEQKKRKKHKKTFAYGPWFLFVMRGTGKARQRYRFLARS